MLQAIYPIVLMVLGAVGYYVSTNPKIQELSRLLFAAGAFALAFQLSGRSFTL